MSETYYQSAYTGAQIDNALGRIIGGELDQLADAATSAYEGVKQAVASIPEGDTPIVNDLTTGGSTMALSAEMGKVLGRRPNPNILDNWYCPDAINQRGFSSVTGGSGYSLDRWTYSINSGTTLSYADGLVTLNNGGSSAVYFRQYLETALEAGTYTVSAKVTALSGTVKLVLAYSDATFSESVTLALGVTSLTIDATKNIKRVQFQFSAGASVTIEAVKLERGDTQTLAHQDADGNWVLNDPPPNKALETLKCQRHYQIFRTSSLRPTYKEDFRPPMRIDPALSTIDIDGVTYYTADANL